MIEEVARCLYKSPMTWDEAKMLIHKVEKEYKNSNVDDYLIKLFEGENRKNLTRYKNTTLLDSVLLCFVWHRVHRALLWDSSSEVFSPFPSKLEKVTAIINRVSRLLPKDSPLISFSKFMVFCIKGEYQRACELANTDIPEGCYLEYYISGIKSFQLPSYEPEYKRNFSLPTFGRSEESKSPVFLLSCDESYYEQFHESFIRSARSGAIKNTIVFIVVGEQESVYHNRENDFYKINVVLDFNYSPALYASARFLFAKDVVKKFASSVFIFDIDFDFNNLDLESFRKIESSEIGLSFNKYGRSYVPWSNISAAACYFSESRIANIFLNAFCLYFEETYMEDRWWIDQNALFYAHKVSSSLFPSGNIANMIDVRDKGVTNHLSSVLEFKKINSSR